ncbi:MAG: hypothetical protein GTO03_08230, partial [Planctomycetales bacterium]|nr:hypothetical protein [Planctomycetales bacterium]
PGIGKIENGRYEATISTGKKVVRISSLVPAGEPDPTGLVPTKETLPAKYNTESQLEAVVTESAENKFDFDLVSDKDDVAE